MSQWFTGLGPPTPSSPTQAATLLLEGRIREHSATSLEHKSDPAQPSIQAPDYNSSFAFIRQDATYTSCHLCFFPDYLLPDIFTCERLHRHQFLPDRGLNAFAFSASRDHPINEPWFQVYEKEKQLAGAVLNRKVNCLAIESRDRVAIAHDAHVDIYDRQKKRYVITEQISMPGHSPVVTKFAGETLLTGTKAGTICAYNMRKGQFDWSIQAEGKGGVHDFHLKKGILYASTYTGLWMWDTRDMSKTRRKFVAHRNRGKNMTFDVDTNLGLLAAGGDDGVVRIWNCRAGEEPVGDLRFPGEIPLSVRFVREQVDGEQTLGMWIATRKRLYTCVVDAGSFS